MVVSSINGDILIRANLIPDTDIADFGLGNSSSKFVAGYFEEGYFDYLQATTANLSMLHTNSIQFYDTTSQSSFFTSMSYDQDSQVFSTFVQGDGEYSQVDIDSTSIKLSGISQIKRGSYTYSFPQKSGTFALTSDIPDPSLTATVSTIT